MTTAFFRRLLQFKDLKDDQQVEVVMSLRINDLELVEMSKDDRIGSDCWYRDCKIAAITWRTGIIRAWSTTGAGSIDGSCPCAIIEDKDDLRCITVDVAQISFASDPDGV